MEIKEFRRKYQGKYYVWESETTILYAYLKKVIGRYDNITHLRTDDEYEFKCIMGTINTFRHGKEDPRYFPSYYQDDDIWFIDATEFDNGSLKRISKKTFKTLMETLVNKHGTKGSN